MYERCYTVLFRIYKMLARSAFNLQVKACCGAIFCVVIAVSLVLSPCAYATNIRELQAAIATVILRGFPGNQFDENYFVKGPIMDDHEYTNVYNLVTCGSVYQKLGIDDANSIVFEDVAVVVFLQKKYQELDLSRDDGLLARLEGVVEKEVTRF